MEIAEFMTRHIEWISADSSIYEAIQRMVERRIRSLAVYFPGDKSKRGVITARDIVFKVLADGKDPHHVKISEIASAPMVCISRTKTIQETLKIMKESNIARVFVCDKGEIVGVLALMDIMYASLIARARSNNNV